MELTEPPQFDHPDRRDIYEYVGSRGTASAEQTRQALGMEHRPFGHHLVILQRKGMVIRGDDELRIAYDDTETHSYETAQAEFTIRQARQEDLDGLVGAIRAAIGSGEYVDAETVADIVDSEGVIPRHNDVESRIFLAATIDGDVAGWVHLERPETAKLGHTAELTVGVLAQYRGQGIGGRLLDRGTEWAADRGCEKLYNSVPSTNDPAIEFLEGHSWETEAVRADHYKLGDEYADEVMLARAFWGHSLPWPGSGSGTTPSRVAGPRAWAGQTSLSSLHGILSHTAAVRSHAGASQVVIAARRRASRAVSSRSTAPGRRSRPASRPS